MGTFAAIVLGLLIGWIIEWIIDWVYWRRRAAPSLKQEEQLRAQLKASEARNAELEHQLAIQKASLSSVQEKLSLTESELGAARAHTMQMGSAESMPMETPAFRSAPDLPIAVAPDDLIAIKGIGPVIAQKLNQAGIYTFADLAAMTPDHLRKLVGDSISRLANEDSIIEQAKQMAAEKSRAAEKSPAADKSRGG